jgi:hypothetical protein
MFGMYDSLSSTDVKMLEKYRNYATRRVMDNAFIYYLNNLSVIMKSWQNIILVVSNLRSVNESIFC